MALACGTAELTLSVNINCVPVTGVVMPSKKNLKNENYLGFFLLIAALMIFATVVKSCNIARYQAEQSQEVHTPHESTKQH
jgi:hypothetical protein